MSTRHSCHPGDGYLLTPNPLRVPHSRKKVRSCDSPPVPYTCLCVKGTRLLLLLHDPGYPHLSTRPHILPSPTTTYSSQPQTKWAAKNWPQEVQRRVKDFLHHLGLDHQHTPAWNTQRNAAHLFRHKPACNCSTLDAIKLPFHDLTSSAAMQWLKQAVRKVTSSYPITWGAIARISNCN